ncbi:MAG TPA: hypothetical protein VMU85_04100 [Stellaceae bacterium]|nr:hypothetical protein [Stellaceae bacterium]
MPTVVPGAISLAAASAGMILLRKAAHPIRPMSVIAISLRVAFEMKVERRRHNPQPCKDCGRAFARWRGDGLERRHEAAPL